MKRLHFALVAALLGAALGGCALLVELGEPVATDALYTPFDPLWLLSDEAEG